MRRDINILWLEDAITSGAHKDRKELVKNISDILIELRPIKNEIFDTIITQATKNKFEL